MFRCSAVLVVFLSVLSMPFVLTAGNSGVFEGSVGMVVVKTLLYRGIVATVIVVLLVALQEAMHGARHRVSDARWYYGAMGMLILVVAVIAAAAQVAAGS